MPSRASLLASLTLFIAATGCATIPGRDFADDEERRRIIDAVVLFGGIAEAVTAEAEAKITFAGRSVSLPGAFIAGAGGDFRVDLLDPLDRPAAIIFGEGERLVQYQPAAAAAASLQPFPKSCSGLDAGTWARALLGRYDQPESWRLRSIFGNVSLVRREGGTARQKIALRRVEERWLPKKVTWYCDGEPALRLEHLEYIMKDGVKAPARFRVSFPAARLKIDLRLDRIETGAAPAPEVLRPMLPRGTAWNSWDLVRETE